MMKRTGFTVILAMIAVVVLAVCVPCFAATEVWDGKTITPVVPAKWTGTNPNGNTITRTTYFISNGAELAWLARKVNSGDSFENALIQVVRDINLGEHEWTPIGTATVSYKQDGNYYKPVISGTNYFRGRFYGMGHTISGLKINDTKSDIPTGLFGFANCLLQQITVTGSVNGKCYVGGLVGYSKGVINDCSTSVDVNGKYYVGGCAGYISEGNQGIDGWQSTTCWQIFAKGTFTGGQYVGGLFGYVDNLSTDVPGNLIATGIVKGEQITDTKLNLDGSYVGGIAGYSKAAFCHSVFEGSISGNGNIGGIAGVISSDKRDVWCSQCISNATISGNEGNTSGAVAGQYLSKSTGTSYWNSQKADHAFGSIQSGTRASSAVSYDNTTIGKLCPVAFSITPESTNAKIGITYTATLKCYPSGSDTSYIIPEWQNINPDNIELLSTTSDFTLKFKIKDNDSYTWNNINGTPILLTVNIKERKEPITNYTLSGERLGLMSWLYMADYASPASTPVIPNDADITPVIATMLTSTESLPDSVKSLTCYKDGIVVPFADALTQYIKDNGDYSAEIDTSVTMQGIPVFSADIESGKTVLATFKAKLNEFVNTPFNKICIVKILKDGSLAKFTVNQDLKSITRGQFCISDFNGNQVDPTATPTAGTDYLISVAVKDGSSFDIGTSLGDVLDPAFLAASTTASNSGGSPDGDSGGGSGGGGGGCSLGFTALALLAVPILFYRKMKHHN